MIAGAARETLRVLAALPYIEWKRRTAGPGPLVVALRGRADRLQARSVAGRDALRRVIRAVDARIPGGGNCYRRALLEMALDAGAAREPLHLGLRAHGGPKTGHAWLGSPSTPEDHVRYDAEFVV